MFNRKLFFSYEEKHIVNLKKQNNLEIVNTTEARSGVNYFYLIPQTSMYKIK